MKNHKNIAFIDGQNLHLGTKAEGWSVDYLIHKQKFKKIIFPSKKFASSLYKKLGWQFYDNLVNHKHKIKHMKKAP